MKIAFAQFARPVRVGKEVFHGLGNLELSKVGDVQVLKGPDGVLIPLTNVTALRVEEDGPKRTAVRSEESTTPRRTRKAKA